MCNLQDQCLVYWRLKLVQLSCLSSPGLVSCPHCPSPQKQKIQPKTKQTGKKQSAAAKRQITASLSSTYSGCVFSTFRSKTKQQPWTKYLCVYIRVQIGGQLV